MLTIKATNPTTEPTNLARTTSPIESGRRLFMRFARAGFALALPTMLLSCVCHAQEAGETLRAIVGFEQSGASSASSVQRFFGNLYVSAPFPWKKKAAAVPDGTFSFGPRVRLLMDGRITTVPQQITSGISDFAAQFPQTVGAIKVNEVAQATEFLTGTEIRLFGMDTAKRGFDGSTYQRFSLNLVFEAGVTTPLTPKATIEVFDIGPSTLAAADRQRLQTMYPQTNGAAYAAFASQDRDRFFRQYYGGFRFKTYYFDKTTSGCPSGAKECAGPALARFPSMLDFQVGANEAVTGGRFRGSILRLDAFQSIPVGGWAGIVYVYGTFMLKPVRSNITNPLLLQSASLCSAPNSPAGCVSVPASNVAMIYTPQFNRDYYRIGAGVELLTLISQIKTGGKTQ